MAVKEILDRVRAHYREHGKCIVNNVGRYRGQEDDECCFVGLFIPNDAYTPDIEDLHPDELPDDVKQHLTVLEPNVEFWKELQATHDMYHGKEAVTNQLDVLEATYGH